MNQCQNGQPQGSFLANYARIYREWHDRAKAIDTKGCSPSTPKMPFFWRARSSQPYLTTNRTVERIAPVFRRGRAATPK